MIIYLRIFFIPSIFFFTISFSSFGQDSSNIKIPNDTSAFYGIEMNDGTLLKGRILGEKNNLIKFLDNNLGEVTIQKRKISSLEKLSADSYFIFFMKDGSFLHGRIIRQNKNEVEIKIKNNSVFSDSLEKKIIVPFERVEEMRQIEEKDIHRRGKYWYPNMNASRYFWGPSAIPMKKGDGYYQNADLIINSANYGITKNFSLQGGTILPFAVFLMPKAGFKVHEKIHLGGGLILASTLLKYRKTNYKVGAMYGLATFGSNNNNLTFGMGYGFLNANNETNFIPKPILTFDGTMRISRRIALVTENVVVPIKYSYYMAAGKVTEYNYKTSYSFGGRLMKEKITVDFGLLSIPNDLISGFVYIDFAIRF